MSSNVSRCQFLAGNLTIRIQRSLTWDAAVMKVTRLAGANKFVTWQYRAGLSA